jgi:SpoVK/Ycf46/Vps4 family AAA+-type ATPase
MSSIKALYKLADFLSPCIIMLEDLDLFSQDRDRGGDVLGLGALMNILDGVNTISNSVTIGTTNRLKSIEGALRNRPGRFDRIIEIPPLPKDLREKMLKERLSGWQVTKKTLKYVTEKMNEWTGAEIQEFINSLNLKHISSKRTKRKMEQEWAEEIIGTLSNFGVGEASSGFGFSKNK